MVVYLEDVCGLIPPALIHGIMRDILLCATLRMTQSDKLAEKSTPKDNRMISGHFKVR